MLTPNINEYKRLVQKVLSCEVNDEDAPEQVLSLAKRLISFLAFPFCVGLVDNYFIYT